MDGPEVGARAVATSIAKLVLRDMTVNLMLKTGLRAKKANFFLGADSNSHPSHAFFGSISIVHAAHKPQIPQYRIEARHDQKNQDRRCH